ncbi:MAG: radical SAM/SPASM domain-containing protein [Pseudomonadota bacterium]
MDPLDFPNRLTLELTNACIYSCPMCPSRLRPREPKGFMDEGLFRRLADEAAEHLPVALVPFFRGESLLHPRLSVLLAYAKSRGLGPIQLVSNGLLLTDFLAGELLDLGLDFISFSLDTVWPDEYAQIRRGGSFETVMANVMNFLDRRTAGGYATEVRVSATRTAINRDNLDDFIEFWRDKADLTRIYYEHSTDGHTGSLDCPEIPRAMERRACLKPFCDMVIYWNGEAALCNHDWYRSPSLGNAAEAPLRRIWHGPAYVALRGWHLQPKKTLDDPTCLHCDHWKMYYLPQSMVGEIYPRRRPERAVLRLVRKPARGQPLKTTPDAGRP